MTVIVEAPGKINLTLEIFGRRPDGYHDIRSVLLPVSLTETITVTDREDEQIHCFTRGDGVNTDTLNSLPTESHLAVKAARKMQALCNTTRGCDITITKRIPVGAGMGGGSADAAGVMVALQTLWGNEKSSGALLQTAATIGSDVPALLHGGAVLMEGRGETISPVLQPNQAIPPPFWLVIVFPGVTVSTRNIYEKCVPHLTREPQICKNAISSVRDGDVQAASSWVFNGLQDTVYKLYPETERFSLALRKGGALSSLVSGSGSAVFGLAECQEHALDIQKRLQENVWSRVVMTMPDGVMAAHGPLMP